MNYNAIGWDAHLEREWAWYCKEEEAYTLGERIEELEDELSSLEEQILEAEGEGRHDDARALEIQYDQVQEELDSLMHR